MRRLSQIVAAAGLALLPAVGEAHHIDPAEVVTQAFEVFKNTGNNAEVRALFSSALREGAHDGVLDPSFALVYAMYADISRFENNPSFALQLCEQGLDLLLTAETPDQNVRNALLVSRAYALADLGRYQEAIEAAQIQVLWMAQEFGQKNADGLEAEMQLWAKQVSASDADYKLPSVADLSMKLATEARDAVNAGDTAKALMLASRALVPPNTGLSDQAVKLLNGTAHTVAGVAYGKESRHANALTAFRRAIELIVTTPWDGKGKPQFDAEFVSRQAGRDLAWDLFSNMASSASFDGDNDLAISALAVAADFADRPDRRVTVILQQAGIAFRGKDYAAAEKTFVEGIESARAAGDEQNAVLAEFYLAIARLFLAEQKPGAPELAVLASAAEKAAAAHCGDLWMAEYIMSTAIRTGYFFRFEYVDVAGIADKAFDMFLRRQAGLAGYETGQDSARTEQRSFLEIYVGAQYEADQAGR